ncbi:hypothetical protein ACRFB9_28195 [Klebsiella pneumoniae]
MSESRDGRGVVGGGSGYLVRRLEERESEVIIVWCVEVKKRKGMVMVCIEFESMELKEGVEDEVDFVGNKIV